MPRLLLVLALAGLLYASWRTVARLPAWQRRRLGQAALWLLALALVVLAATGRIHWLTAALAPLAIAARWIGRVVMAWPVVSRLLSGLGGARGGGARGGGARGEWARGASEDQRSRRDPGEHAGNPPRRSSMSDEQARAILGVAPSATREEIVAAHRQMMQRVHPDKGGSDYLAAQINQARDVLLKRP